MMNADGSDDFLAGMAASSAERARRLRDSISEQELLRKIAATPAPPLIRFDPAGFDLIAEIKTVSPSSGILATGHTDLRTRAEAYVAAGACAVSVLTETRRFGGCLEHLNQVANAILPHGIPAMAKDFLVDPCQIMAARAAGAGGVLLIVRMMDDERLADMLDCAGRLGMFTLIEAFDAQDLARAHSLLDRVGTTAGTAMVGVNCRDLRTLTIDAGRLETLVDLCPADRLAVAESGMLSAADAGRAARLGYRVGLVGTALMRTEEPGALVQAMLVAGRAQVRRRA